VMGSMKSLEAVPWYVPTSLTIGFCLSQTTRLKVSKTQYDRVWSYIESGKKEGAKVIVGGEKRTTPGYWVDATSMPALPVLPGTRSSNSLLVFTDIRPDMKIVSVACKYIRKRFETIFPSLGERRGIRDRKASHSSLVR
jgi:hypothetical protein